MPINLQRVADREPVHAAHDQIALRIVEFQRGVLGRIVGVEVRFDLEVVVVRLVIVGEIVERTFGAEPHQAGAVVAQQVAFHYHPRQRPA